MQVIRHTSAIASALSLVAVIGVSGALAQPSPAPRYVLTSWASEKGLPPGDVFAITQDSEGYLWLGTPTGLFQFDGARFTRWLPPAPASLPSGPVHALVGSPDGSLWVGFGGGGGIVRIHRGEVVRHSQSDGAPAGATAMIQDRHGTIWVATRRGLYRCADGRWTLMGVAQGLDAFEVFSLHEDREGVLWVATGRGIYRQSGATFTRVDPAASNVQSLTSDRSGALWVTDPNRILRRLSASDAPALAPDIRLPVSAWRLMEDGKGQIWIAAIGGGLLRIASPDDPNAVIERFSYEHRLAGSPRSLYEDRDGNIWVGMRGGLLRLSENAFATGAALEGLTNEGVRTAAAGNDGSVWVATGHGLNRFLGGEREAFGLSQTMALHTDRHGVLWVSAGRQLGRWVGGRLMPIAVPEEVRASRVMAMTSDSHDRLWLCTSLRGVMTWDGHAIDPFEREGTRSCQSIFTDSQDRVWIGFLVGGAAVFDKGSIQSFGPGDGLVPGTVLSILEDRSGSIWLSTPTGISRYRNGRFTAITQANAPVADLVPVLVEDEEGYIWAGVNSGAGVIRFHPGEVDKIAAAPDHQLEYALFDESDGMQEGSQTWQSGVGGVRGGDGRLWIATGVGMTIIDPAKLPSDRPPSTPRIEEVTADGRRVTPQPRLALPPNTSTLRIAYGAVSLSSASKLRFRYMLEGFDEGWVYAGRTTDATYANLPSGEYQFRVSTTQDGRWSEAGLWDFSVQPPFYRTRPFLAIAAFGVATTLASAWWLRLRTMRNQFDLVFAERARLSREIHDTLLQSLAAIGVEIETIATQLAPSEEEARTGLRRLRRQVAHCLREARESILELRQPSMTTPPALLGSLRELADATTRAKGVAIELSSSGRPCRCTGEAHLQLFRIAQEAINNAIRHGHAMHVRIDLAYQPDRVVLTVADDGCGFAAAEHEPAPPSGEHFGLLSMRERAARVRGQIAILSSPGKGTTIEATVPLVKE